MRPLLMTCFFFCIAVVSFFAGTGDLHRWNQKRSISFAPLVENIHPEKEMTQESDPTFFAIVLYAYNAAPWCERALHSIFKQDYETYRILIVDDGSIDGTFERMQQLILEAGQGHRTIAMRNESKLGSIASLYRAADHCFDREVLIPLDATNWLVHERVLSRLSQVFQNPDTWVAFGEAIQYPSYSIVATPFFDLAAIEQKGFRMMPAFDCPALAFYAGLFHKIQLPDLFENGRFLESKQAYIKPILEQSGGRFRCLDEPLFFVNLASPQRQCFHRESDHHSPYHPLCEWPLFSPSKQMSADIVIFSSDRPLQLYATLESMQRTLNGRYTLHVLYSVSDERFNTAYHLIQESFPEVSFLKKTSRQGFKSLLTPFFESKSVAEFILFASDDMVMKDFVNLDSCMKTLDKTGAYAFYLYFGRHLAMVPPSTPLSNGIYAWDFRNGNESWQEPNQWDLALYRKADLRRYFLEWSYKDLPSLEAHWKSVVPPNQIGLYFEQSKMVHLPLNVGYLTTEELLLKFIQGFKINIDPLFRVENPALSSDLIPEFIKR